MLDVYKYIYFLYLYIRSHIYIYIIFLKIHINIRTYYTPYMYISILVLPFTALPKFFNGRIAFSMGFKHVSCHQGWSLEILFIVNDGRLWKPSLPPGGNCQRCDRSPFLRGFRSFWSHFVGAKKSTKEAAHVSGQIITTFPAEVTLNGGEK